jgi:hypothetical protein
MTEMLGVNPTSEVTAAFSSPIDRSAAVIVAFSRAPSMDGLRGGLKAPINPAAGRGM